MFHSKCVRERSNVSQDNTKYKFDKPSFDKKLLKTELPLISPKAKKYLGVLGYKLPLPFSILPFIRHSKYPEKPPQTVQHENRPSRHGENE
jgi:hypothetical protein